MQNRSTRRRSTGIEWTEHTWNPFVGCSIKSAGCTNCYAMRQAERLIGFNPNSIYAGTVKNANGRPVWTGKIRRGSAETWRKPLRIKTASMFFVNSMSDFFHEDAPDEWRTEALAVMAATPHQYQILTKRPEVILAYLERTGVRLPMNAWIGVTIERGDFVDRLDVLREVPAEIRFVSAEPLLGALGPLNLSGIHWIITGGESGPGARPMNADWIREIREQCLQQDVAHFFKQWGKLENNPLYSDRVAGGGTITWARQAACEDDPHGKGGSLLDGRHWKQYPNHEIQAALL